MAQTLNDRPKGSTSTSDGRVILHVDLDCFYAACYLIPSMRACFTGGGSAARYSQGHTPGRAAVGELQLIHVETVGGAPGAGRNAGKVSLERYRAASQRVFSAFRRVCPTVERASIDEAYMDVSATVVAMLSRAPPAVPPAPDEPCAATGASSWAAAWDEQWRALLESVTEVKVGSVTEVKAGSGAEVEVGSGTEAKAGSGTEANAGSGAEAKAGSGTEANAGDAPEVKGEETEGGGDGDGTGGEGLGEEGEGKDGVQQRVGETKREHAGAESGGAALAVPKARLVVKEGPLDARDNVERSTGTGGSQGTAGGERGSSGLDARDDVERRLQAGVVIAHRLQQEVLSSLGYTVSVGVARCKLLAKMASAMTKPFGITVVRRWQVYQVS
ncbi:unnamed protein product [Closterium sp. Yama58-4]|nr:unnamed protein product [Closterium sp. Yama58-4]